MAVATTAVTALKISAAQPATYDSAGYATLFAGGAFIGEITDLGIFGREYALVTHEPIGSRGVNKYKGSYNEGTMSLSLGLDSDDAGQIIMKAALLSDDDYSFQITLQGGEKYYFQAKVMSWKISVGSVDSITTATCNLELTTNNSGIGIVESLVSFFGQYEMYAIILSPSNTAEQNAAVIQSELDTRNSVIIEGDGVFEISSTLEIPSNTQINIGAGVELKCVGSTPFLVFVNKNYNSTPKSVTSLTVAAIGHYMLRATINYSSTPDVVAGDYVLIKGDTSNIYNKIHRVESVSGNNVTFLIGQANSNTSSAIGTLTATKADANIGIYGPGRLNGNFISGTFTQASDYRDHAIMLNNVHKPVVKNIEINDFRKYAVCLANCVYPETDNIYGNSGSDCIHIYGPCWAPKINNVSGVFGDDAAVIQTIDGVTYAAYQPPNSGGSIYEGAQISNINTDMNGNSGGVVFYPAGGDGTGDLGYTFYGTYEVDNVGHAVSHKGSINPGSSFTIGGGYVTDVGRIDKVVVRDVRGKIVLNNAGANKTITIGMVVIDGQTTHDLGENAVLMIDYLSISQLIIPNFSIYNPVSTDNKYVDLLSSNVNIGSLILRDGILNNLGNTMKLIRSVGATVGKITVDNVNGNSGCTFIDTSGVEFAGTLDINFLNCNDMPANAITIGGAQNANIYANNLSCSSTVYNLWGSGTVKIKSDYVVTDVPPFVNAQSNTTLVNPQQSKAIVRSTPTTGQTVTIQAGKTLGYCNTAHLIAPSGTLAALTLALPSDPIDGEVIKITITQAITALTISGGTLLGVTSGAPSSAGFNREFTYSLVDTMWV